MVEASELLTVPKAAKRIRRTPAALYAAIERGDLECVRMFDKILVEPAALLAYRKSTKIGRPKNGNRKAGK